jgi:hypothetical protein
LATAAKLVKCFFLAQTPGQPEDIKVLIPELERQRYPFGRTHGGLRAPVGLAELIRH